MAEWRDFNATNEPDTCIWCGKKLRYKPKRQHPETVEYRLTPDSPNWDEYSGETEQWAKRTKYVVDEYYEKAGDYQDGFFCGLRCGYLFGERMAQLNHRLSKKVKGE